MRPFSGTAEAAGCRMGHCEERSPSFPGALGLCLPDPLLDCPSRVGLTKARPTWGKPPVSPAPFLSQQGGSKAPLSSQSTSFPSGWLREPGPTAQRRLCLTALGRAEGIAGQQSLPRFLLWAAPQQLRNQALGQLGGRPSCPCPAPVTLHSTSPYCRWDCGTGRGRGLPQPLASGLWDVMASVEGGRI